MIEIFNLFLENDFDVYFVGQKFGICSKKYVVIRDAGTMPILGSNKAGTQIIDIIGYVPNSKYIEIEEFKENIKEVMKECPARITGQESAIVPDNMVKGYSFVITYQIQKLIQ